MMGSRRNPSTIRQPLWHAVLDGLARDEARQQSHLNAPTGKGLGRWSCALIAMALTSAAPLALAQITPAAALARPEAASATQTKPGWATRHFAVAAANPLATQAGYAMLRAGGSAVDAAIAVQMVLALVEPQSSGIGGGAFLLHFDGKSTQAGYTVLRAGGSAVDAAIAVQMVLALVEPQSSGIGGGAFLLHFDGKTTQAFDGRETAPAAATRSAKAPRAARS